MIMKTSEQEKQEVIEYVERLADMLEDVARAIRAHAHSSPLDDADHIRDNVHAEFIHFETLIKEDNNV